MVEFQEKYKEEYGEETFRESAIGYTLVETMIQAMDQVDGDYANSVPEMAEGLRGREEPFQSPFGPIVFDENGQATRNELSANSEWGKLFFSRASLDSQSLRLTGI